MTDFENKTVAFDAGKIVSKETVNNKVLSKEVKSTYVTFEQAKLLKGKILCNSSFGDNTPMPEQWQVIEWLRVNHGIWIVVSPLLNHNFFYTILDLNSDRLIPLNYGDDTNFKYKFPQEAYSAAFDYVLNNLI